MLGVDLARDRVHGIDTKTVYTGAGVTWLGFVGVGTRVFSSPGTGDWKWGDAAVLRNRIYAAPWDAAMGYLAVEEDRRMIIASLGGILNFLQAMSAHPNGRPISKQV